MFIVTTHLAWSPREKKSKRNSLPPSEIASVWTPHSPQQFNFLSCFRGEGMDVFWNYTVQIGDSKLYLFPFSDLSVYASDLTDYFPPRWSCAEEPVPRFCCVEQPQHFENKNCCTWQYCKTAQIIPNSTPHTVSRMGQSQHRSTSRSQKLLFRKMAEKIQLLLRASLCKILISSFDHKMDFAHNLSVDFF